MNLTNLVDTLARHEGVRRLVYEDSLGVLTIGVGRNLQDVGLSDDEIYYLLKNDIRRCETELDNAFRWYKDLDQVRQEAMINLCFNVGITKLRKFKLALRAMEARDYNDAADEFLDSLWATQVGQRAVEVAEMIRTGNYGK